MLVFRNSFKRMMALKVDLENIKNRIRALAAMTTANGCSENEATIAMRKVGELLQSYNLSMDEVDLRSEPFETVKIDSEAKQRQPVFFCMSSIAKFTDTKVWLTRYPSGITYSFFGQTSDVLMARYLYDLIGTSIDRELKMFKKTDIYKFSRRRKTTSTSFGVGMATRVAQRLEEMYHQRIREMQRDRGSNSLVVLKSQLVEQGFKNLNLKQIGRASCRERV